MDIAAVVTDLDGTIIGSNGISPATLAAFAELDVPLVAATARTPAGLTKLSALVPYVRLAICCNGALGYDPTSGQHTWRHEIDQSTVETVCAVIDERLPDAGIGAYDGDRWTLDRDYARARGKTPSGEYVVGPRWQVATVRACALGVSHPRLRSGQIANDLADAGIGPDHAQVSYGAPDVLDISPPGVDKGTGVLAAVAGLGVDPGDVVCSATHRTTCRCSRSSAMRSRSATRTPRCWRPPTKHARASTTTAFPSGCVGSCGPSRDHTVQNGRSVEAAQTIHPRVAVPGGRCPAGRWLAHSGPSKASDR